MAHLAIESVSKSFGATEVLRDVSLEIADGEFLSLLGPSGCGKSTLLRIIAGLVGQDKGSVKIDGEAIDHRSPRERNIAMVFQNYALYPHMTVWENVALPILVSGLNSIERLPGMQYLWPRSRRVHGAVDEQVRQVSASLEIDQLLDRRPDQLSGGQQQRVALARAIVRKPHAFLLDEPFSNLDAKLRVQLRSEIAALHAKLGETFVFVTHDQAEALTLSSRIAVMLHGKLLQIGTPQEIFDDPNSLAVAEFIGNPPINLFSARHEGGRVLVGGATLTVSMDYPSNEALTLAVRPECVEMVAPDDSQATAIKVIVTRIEYLGTDTYAYLRPVDPGVTPSDRELVARLPSAQRQAPKIGQVLGASFMAEDALFFGREGERIAALPEPGRLRGSALHMV